MNHDLTPEKLDMIEKHFQNAPSQPIQPSKPSHTQKVDIDMVQAMDDYWMTDGVKWATTYKMGKLMAKANEFKKSTQILTLLGQLIILGIKGGSANGGISSEKMRNHFDTFLSLLKAIESDLNASFERINGENNDNLKEFDNVELLALLNGLPAVKTYEKRQA